MSTQGFPPAPEHGTPPQYPIESVDNALQVLFLLGEQPELRLTDVSRYLGVASSTAHRLLAMLQYRGFVRQDGATRSYTRGPTLDGMALGILRRLDVRARARPVLERLNAELRETVHLGRLEGSRVHFIDSVESTQALRVGSRLGWSMPAHCTSTGKALLAQLPEEELVRRYPDEPLERLTSRSVGTRAKLLADLERVREQGHAVSREESEEGVCSLAVALGPGRRPGYAVNVAVPAPRMNRSTQGTVLAALLAAVAELDSLLG